MQGRGSSVTGASRSGTLGHELPVAGWSPAHNESERQDSRQRSGNGNGHPALEPGATWPNGCAHAPVHGRAGLGDGTPANAAPGDSPVYSGQPFPAEVPNGFPTIDSHVGTAFMSRMLSIVRIARLRLLPLRAFRNEMTPVAPS